MDRIDVSQEMVTFIGAGVYPAERLPNHAFMFAFRLDGKPTVEIDQSINRTENAEIVCFVAKSACSRIFGRIPDVPALYHLPAELRVIAAAIRDCDLSTSARMTLRLAKSIELICAIFTALDAGSLVPAGPVGTLSERDANRIVLARRMIDEHWREKLTIETIARASGLNRAKLTRGYRAIFGTSVADAISERRLGGARALLLATDMPVASVGYACGYQNNASFTRAFVRRFGIVPTRLRAGEGHGSHGHA